MADNTTLNPGTGGDIIATDDVSGVKFQRVKLDVGGDGASSPLLRGQQAKTGSIPVTLASDEDTISVDTGLTTQTDALTNTELRATPIGVDGSGVTQPVSGTFWQATQPVSGSVTANAGTNLNTSALALDATLSGAIKAEDAASSSGDKGIPTLAVRQATATDLSAGNTDGDYEPLQVDANGKLHVNPGTVTVASHAVTNAGTFAVQATEADGANTTLGAKADAKSTATDTTAVTIMSVLKQISASTQAPPSQAVTNSGTFATQPTIQTGSNQIGHLEANQSTNVAQINGVTPLMGAGNTGTGSARVTIATDDVNLSAIAAAVHTEDVASAGADKGIAMMAIRDDTLNSTSGTEGDYELLHTTADGALWVTQAPSTSNGWSTFNATSSDGATALTNTAQAIKASAGTLGGWYVYNPNATAQFVQLYNTASGSVTVGTTNPLFMLTIPATSAANIEFGNGINFATAMSCSATSTAGGNGAPSTALDAVFFYK